MMYSVDFSSQAVESVSKLDKAISDRVFKKIEWFPSGVGKRQKLT
jgi:mRNA-degrading endonuclease RelE of RelBE toxin-antitoxin system